MSKKNLSEILSLDKIEVVKSEINQAHGLPNECYISEEYLEFERDNAVASSWTVIGTASSVPEAGDTIPFDLSLIHICRCRRYSLSRSLWSPYH